ncbi:GNAT family N-acetyltransferase [Paenibacillus hamazuiensis]|uniref:GNAT family N-acetyltransferase n=1 Tax=Paenibacillus hamazuiensis TaxID=2936508 RepID=UPI00200D475A|nr:GNAT family N-acetyltransferase [Paenibacillus hamazuiensis]
MAEEIRNLKEAELEESIRLSAFAFQYELKDGELEERKAKLKPEQQWGYFVDGKLASKLTLLDLNTWMQGRLFAMGGIASVATWPEYRRGGMVAKLLLKALETMKEQGQMLSYLHPFEFPFYRKYGWEMLTEHKRYELERMHLPELPPQPGRIERIGPNAKRLGPIYEEYAARYSGMLQRSAEWWEERILRNKKGTAAVWMNPEGDDRGYILYEVKDRTMTIHELILLDEAAWRGLWKFIANHDSMIRTVKLQAPAEDRLPVRLGNPRCKQETVPYFMVRVVDVEAFLRQYPFARTEEGAELTLRVEDTFASWNDGIFGIRITPDGTASIERPAASDKDLAADVSCDIQTLSTMLAGYQRPVFLRQTGRLQASEGMAALLEKLIPDRPTYLMDFF